MVNTITTRQEAIGWWRNLKWLEILKLMPNNRHVESLTGREIEKIWRNHMRTKIMKS